MSKEEMEDENNKNIYDIQLGMLTKFVAILYIIICSVIVFCGCIYGLLYAIKGKYWMDEKFKSKDE